MHLDVIFLWPGTWRMEGEGLGSPSWTPPSHHSTSTGSGGPMAAQVRLKGVPANIATSWGSWVKWGTPAGRRGGEPGARWETWGGGDRAQGLTFHGNPRSLRGEGQAVELHLTPVLTRILLLDRLHTETDHNTNNSTQHGSSELWSTSSGLCFKHLHLKFGPEGGVVGVTVMISQSGPLSLCLVTETATAPSSGQVLNFSSMPTFSSLASCQITQEEALSPNTCSLESNLGPLRQMSAGFSFHRWRRWCWKEIEFKAAALCLLQDVCLTIKQHKRRAAGRLHGVFYHFNILATTSQLRVKTVPGRKHYIV